MSLRLLVETHQAVYCMVKPVINTRVELSAKEKMRTGICDNALKKAVAEFKAVAKAMRLRQR